MGGRGIEGALRRCVYVWARDGWEIIGLLDARGGWEREDVFESDRTQEGIRRAVVRRRDTGLSLGEGCWDVGMLTFWCHTRGCLKEKTTGK